MSHPKSPSPSRGLPPDIAAISVGASHACALTKGGAVLCWGRNKEGQLGNGSTIDSVLPVGASGLGSGVVSISAGGYQTCAVTDAGTVSCWGRNVDDAEHENLSSLAPVTVAGLGKSTVSVSAGAEQVCAVTATGSALCWGNNYHGELGNDSTQSSPSPVPVVGLASGVATVVAAQYETCAVTTERHVLCWGQNQWGELGDGTTTERHSPVQVLAQ